MHVDEPLRFEMNRLVSYDDQSLLSEICRVAQLLPPGPITRQAFSELARVSTDTLIRRFGGWEAALERADLGDRYSGKRVTAKMQRQQGRGLSAEDMTNELRRIAALLGRQTITRADLLEHSQIMSERAVLNRFGTWKAALAAAELELSPHGRRWTEDDYFDNLLEVWTHHGRAPKYAEMGRPPSQISPGGYEARFGSWGRAKQAFVDRVNSDIAPERSEPETKAPANAQIEPRLRQEDQRTIPVGLRYQVLRRDNFKCVLCGRSPATEPTVVLHVDHILAFSRGGKTKLENLRSLCQDCNLGKGTRD